MTQNVVALALTNEIDPWAFVEPFVTLHPFALVELTIAAVAGWFLPKWHHGVFGAAIFAPIWLAVFFLPGPFWILPLDVNAALSGAHFFVLLLVFSVMFGAKRFMRL